MMRAAVGLDISYSDAISSLLTFDHRSPIPWRKLVKHMKGFVTNSAVPTKIRMDLMLSAVGNWRKL